jgi:hypothetical protein
MSWKSFQNKNRSHKENFQKELGEITYQPFDDCDREYYTFLYSLFIKITKELPGKSEKEWAEMMQYNLKDLGFITYTHSLYFNCFIFTNENKVCLLSKSANPSLLLKLKGEYSSVLVICVQDIKEYSFTGNTCIIKKIL